MGGHQTKAKMVAESAQCGGTLLLAIFKFQFTNICEFASIWTFLFNIVTKQGNARDSRDGIHVNVFTTQHKETSFGKLSNFQGVKLKRGVFFCHL